MSFDEFLKSVCPALDLNWRKYRRRSSRHNVLSRMRELGIGDFGSYAEFVDKDPAEAARLPYLMNVTVSRFFRDMSMWNGLASNILPPLLGGKKAGDVVRVWSAGCCGGEEPYTFAILWLDRLRTEYPDIELELLATDIDVSSLQRAVRGEYAEGSLKELPEAILKDWFLPYKGLWKLDERVKRLVKFRRHNLLTDPPPDGIDIALCRYLAFTYYSGERLLLAAKRLHDALRPGGLLMVGLKETLPPRAIELFHPAPGQDGFYIRKESCLPPTTAARRAP